MVAPAAAGARLQTAGPQSSQVFSERSAKQIASAVDKRYNSLKSLQADFQSTYRGAGMARNESGVLWLRKPGQMRWEYRNPREKVFISDGKTAYFYVEGERQARKAPVKKIDDLRSPLGYLLGKTKLEKQFENLRISTGEQPSEAGNVVLKGVPKALADRVAEVTLEISPSSEIRRIVIEELDGARTEFRFSNLQYNVPVAVERFKFKAPPGVDMIATEDVAP